jgi:uncharacterized protein (TIGR02147 family)
VHRVYDHEDWRVFLQEELERRREGGADGSVRDFARKMGVDSAQFHRILAGRAPLPFRHLSALVELLGLDRRATAFFEELVRLDRARTEEEKSRCRERLSALRGVAASPVEGTQAQFYQNWRHTVVRALVGSGRVRGDGSELAGLASPPLSEQEARDSVALLLDLGLVERGEDGSLRLRDAHVVSGPDIPVAVVRGYHRESIQQARRALREIPPGERDISAVTTAVDAAGFATLREMARELRQKVQKLSHGTRSPDRIFQVNVQLFPVAWGSRGGAP